MSDQSDLEQEPTLDPWTSLRHVSFIVEGETIKSYLAANIPIPRSGDEVNISDTLVNSQPPSESDNSQLEIDSSDNSQIEIDSKLDSKMEVKDVRYDYSKIKYPDEGEIEDKSLSDVDEDKFSSRIAPIVYIRIILEQSPEDNTESMTE